MYKYIYLRTQIYTHIIIHMYRVYTPTPQIVSLVWYRADATYQDFQLKGFISLAAELGTFIQLHVDLATFSDPSPS